MSPGSVTGSPLDCLNQFRPLGPRASNSAIWTSAALNAERSSSRTKARSTASLISERSVNSSARAPPMRGSGLASALSTDSISTSIFPDQAVRNADMSLLISINSDMSLRGAVHVTLSLITSTLPIFPCEAVATGRCADASRTVALPPAPVPSGSV